MKTYKNWSYKNVILLALTIECILVIIQFIAMKLYAFERGSDVGLFGRDYMLTTGFYVFLFGGFFVYVVATYGLLKNIRTEIARKLFAMVIAGGIIELAFYLVIQSPYEGVYVYSILGKIIAVAVGLIFFNVTANESRSPESYF